MGRKLKPLKDRDSNVFLFEYPLHDAEALETMESFHTIIRREGIPFNRGMRQAIEEYVRRHGDGNTQTLLASYQPGGKKSEGQLEQEVVRFFQGLKREVNRKEVLEKVITDLGYSRGRASQVADGLVRQLRDSGVRVWR